MNPGGNIKVLLLRSSTGVFGAERVVLELSEAMSNADYTACVGVIANQHPDHDVLAEAARAMALPAVSFACRGPLDMGTVKAIRRFIRQNGIALLNPHGYKANFYALAARAGLGIPCLATLHPWTETDYSLRARLYTFMDTVWLRRMDGLVAVSGNVSDELQRRIPGADCRVIPNGIDTRRFERNDAMDKGAFRKGLGISDGDIIIGSVGRLVPEKGYRFLIDAFARVHKQHPQLKLLLVGDGELSAELREQAARLDLFDAVRFTGVRYDVPELLSLMDMFVLPSLSEGLPMAVLEAMAADKAVIATTVGDIPRVISSGKNGLLVAPGSDEALVEALSMMIDNPLQRETLARAARIYIRENYGSDRMARSYLDAFQKLLPGERV